MSILNHGVGEDGNVEQELVVEEDDAEQLLSTETLDDVFEKKHITVRSCS